MGNTWTLLLPFSLVLGWGLERWRAHIKRHKKRNNLPHNYLQGLNFLLNEEPDKAVDLFIEMLEVDSDTVETHLALGNLFRRRGEVDRAIRIHQNLVMRSNLSNDERNEALFALAQDYLSAGVLDRAETIFKKLVNQKVYLAESYQCLLDIYQREKAWHQAIETARCLENKTDQNVGKALAHYYCELAEIALEDSEVDQANRYLKKALTTDKSCVRATLILGSLEYISGHHKHAIRLYKQVREQDPDFISEVLTPLAEAYQALNEEESLEVYLRKLLQSFPEAPIVLLLSEKIRTWRGDKVAIQFMSDYVYKHPSIAALHRLLDLRLSTANDREREDLLAIRQLTEKMLAKQPNYQCEVCGFASKTIHWLCPSCRRWSTVKSAYLLTETQ